MKMKIAPTLMMLAALVVAAVAVPAMAQPDGHGRPDDAGRPDGAGQGNGADRANGTDRGNGTDQANRSAGPRGPPAHAVERMEARCEAVENETGQRPAACDRLAEIHDGEHRARRVAHAGLGALAAWEHLNETLSKLEAKFEAKLAQDNLTANQTAAYQAKLDKIDAMQERLAERISSMDERIAGVEERHEAVREHVAQRIAARGEGGRPGFAQGDDPDDAEGNETIE